MPVEIAKSWQARCILYVLSALVSGTPAAQAESDIFAPADLYEYEVVTLENGFRAVLNSRGQSPNVRVRLVVHTGLNDYRCEIRELPHLVEHLMFSGYDGIDESELDGMIAEWGGAWNAYTYGGRTTYDAYVHSNFINNVTVLLSMMFEETHVTAEELEAARAVVNAEAGGAAGGIRQFLYRNGLYEGNVERAYRLFAPESNEWCERLLDANAITLDHINDFMTNQHQPANMTLIVVGKFDIERFKGILEATFGIFQGAEPVEGDRRRPNADFVPVDYHTRTEYFLGQEGYVCLEYGLPVWESPERPDLVMIKNYLDTRMFETFRVERGLSYDPGATLRNFGDHSTLMLDASVAVDDMDEAFTHMEELVREVVEHGVPADWIDHIRQSLNYRAASAYESNESIADYYERSLPILFREGEFPDIGSFYDDVTVESTQSVAREYLSPERRLRYTSRPTLSYGGATTLAAMPLLGFAFLRIVRRKKKLTELQVLPKKEP